MLRLPNGQWTSSLEEAYLHLLETHFPGCHVDNHSKHDSIPRWLPSLNFTEVKRIITEDRVRWAIESMAPFKSPGKDDYTTAKAFRAIGYLSSLKVWRKSWIDTCGMVLYWIYQFIPDNTLFRLVSQPKALYTNWCSIELRKPWMLDSMHWVFSGCL